MQIVVPDYYNQFSCIAGDCRHSCCIGWEIDIDIKSYGKYKSIDGKFGERLRSNINHKEPSFVLDANERCPFLNRDNLCDIIINLGEESLCDICREHPRFRNYYSNRTEIGLGLSCVAAAELIIKNKNKLKLIEINEREILLKEEEAFLIDRQYIFDILQDRKYNIHTRIIKLINQYGLYIPDYDCQQWANFFLALEQLDEEWTNRLYMLKANKETKYDCDDLAVEQLLLYFIYRHYSGAIDDGRFEERLSFAIVSTYIICTVSAVCNVDIVESARCYSAEIEYSQDNTEELLQLLEV